MTWTATIPKEKIEEVQRQTDIVALVSQYVPLKRRGGNYLGLCPFHNEKTPSFTVNQQKQFFKCFGCGEGGSVFSFLMKREGITFSEAVRMLARKAGVSLPQGRSASTEKKDHLYQVNLFALEFFKSCLHSEEGMQAREYIGSRGINKDSLERFHIGYAPNQWEGLLTRARAKGFSPEVLLEAGLVIARDGKNGHYDRFRNRLMFPIFDSVGKVIAFGGRSLDGSEPKYMNSPETALFQKSKCLYGIDLARGALYKEKRVLIMEGYTDVIMAHQHEVSWAVGLLGTALSTEHIRLLRPWAEVVILVMDADTAGQSSAERNLETLLREDVETRIAELPEGCDPCDFLLKEGKDYFLENIEKATDFFQFKIKRASEKYDLSTPAGKLACARELFPLVAEIPDELKRELTIKHLAELLAVEERVLRRELQRSKKTPAGGPTRTEETTARKHPLELKFLALLLNHNELIEEYLLEPGHKKFASEPLNQLAEKVFELYKRSGRVTEKDLTPFFDQGETAQLLADIAMEEEKGDYRHLFDHYLITIKKRENKQKIHYTKKRIKEARPSEEEERRLILEYHERHKVRANQSLPRGKVGG